MLVIQSGGSDANVAQRLHTRYWIYTGYTEAAVAASYPHLGPDEEIQSIPGHNYPHLM